jgi:hypothetical protein
MSFWNIFERKSKRQQKRETLAQNQARGKVAERWFVFVQRFWGNKVVRTGLGSDYRVTEWHMFTEKKDTYLAEVKSRKGKLSRLQRETKKKNRNYRVIRINPLIY